MHGFDTAEKNKLILPTHCKLRLKAGIIRIQCKRGQIIDSKGE